MPHSPQVKDDGTSGCDTHFSSERSARFVTQWTLGWRVPESQRRVEAFGLCRMVLTDSCDISGRPIRFSSQTLPVLWNLLSKLSMIVRVGASAWQRLQNFYWTLAKGSPLNLQLSLFIVQYSTSFRLLTQTRQKLEMVRDFWGTLYICLLLILIARNTLFKFIFCWSQNNVT